MSNLTQHPRENHCPNYKDKPCGHCLVLPGQISLFDVEDEALENHISPCCQVGGDQVKPVLDVTCSGRMMWFDKKDNRTVFCDQRNESHVLKDRQYQRHFEITPDIQADFTDLPFDDETFHLVVFDPPHLVRVGETAYMNKKYGRLNADWRDELSRGFAECFRVLKPNGTLIFKWNETQIKLSEVLKCTPEKPLFGHPTGSGKTHWMTFMKGGDA